MKYFHKLCNFRRCFSRLKANRPTPTKVSAPEEDRTILGIVEHSAQRRTPEMVYKCYTGVQDCLLW